jgi:alpha-1,2-mannosyltransferase
MASPLPAPALAYARPNLRARVGLAVLVAPLAAACALYGLVLVQAAQNHQDLDTYLSAARDFLQGRPLYQPFLTHPFPDPTLRPAFIYPPVFAPLAAAFSVLPEVMQPWTWLIAMQAAILLTFTLMMRALRPTIPGVVLAGIATLTFYPLWVDAVQGQANAVVLLLTIGGIVLLTRGHDGGALALGAAAAIKLTPILALLWLAWERRWRAAGLMLLAFGLLTGVGFLARPSDSVSYFRDVLPQLAKGTAYYSNQSLSGVLARLFTTNAYTDPWLPLPVEGVAVVGVGLLLLAFWAVTMRRHDPLARALAFLALLPLLSSVTWEHHLIALLPLCWMVIVELARRGWPPAATAIMAALLIGFDLLARWRPGPTPFTPAFRAAQTGDPLVLLTANSLFLATLAFFLLSPWLLRTR